LARYLLNLIAAMLSSLPISNQFSSSIPRRGENFQPYVKATRIDQMAYYLVCSLFPLNLTGPV